MIINIINTNNIIKIVIIIVVGNENGFAWEDKPPITSIGGKKNFYPET